VFVEKARALGRGLLFPVGKIDSESNHGIKIIEVDFDIFNLGLHPISFIQSCFRLVILREQSLEIENAWIPAFITENEREAKGSLLSAFPAFRGRPEF
jgi:hypothetical protein